MIWIFPAVVVLFVLFWWAVFEMDIRASVARDIKLEHRHDYVRVGYGGAGWFLYRCECGATEIDA